MSGLWILATGVLAEEFFALATHAGIETAGFVENLDRDKAGTSLCGLPIIWVDELPEGAECVCALSTTRRSRFVEQVEGRAHFVVLAHPSSVVLPGSVLGEGTAVSTGVLIGSNTTLGRHVFVNRGARVGHHTRVGDYVTLQPGVNIAGLVTIGRKSYIGMGAVVIERLEIGDGVTIAAGAVVTHDVPPRCLVAGNPAVVRRDHVDPR